MKVLELRIPPPVLLLVVGGLMWMIGRMCPSWRVMVPGNIALAVALGLIGLSVSAAGSIQFRRARTTVNPMKPNAASVLVVTGIYTRTRNPMYVGLVIILLGWAAFISNPVALIALPCFVSYLTRFQIKPEEQALGEKFGPEFKSYRAKVRRWV